MKYVVLCSLPIVALLVCIAGLSSQPPEGKGDKKGGPPDGPPRFQLGKLFPPHLLEELNLTEKQEKQLADLEKEVKAKLEKILTAEQKKIVEDHRPPMKEKDGKKEGKKEKKEDARNDQDHGRPVALIAKELGVTPEKFREAFKNVRPAPASQEPTGEQRRRNRQVLSEALGVTPERLDEVMDKYRPGGKGTNGQDRDN